MLPLLCAYVALFFLTVLGFQLWIKKRRGSHSPVDFKLLRGPGESLRKRVAKYDEDLVFHLGGAAIVPVCVALGTLILILKLHPTTQTGLYLGLGASAVVFLIVLLFAGRWALRGLDRYSNDRLGYLGEREVAEYLSALLAKGHYVFHDVPAEGVKKDFNLDHVAVGPSGVALIETKTRRKRPGFKNHVVIYDGAQLIWPWGKDSHGLEQAKAEAAWLHHWIKQRTGIDTAVKPILALPGWWVDTKGFGDVAVVNPKVIANAVDGRKGPAILAPEQIDLIARQLDVMCRDVEE
jgi:hypothetical protein